MATTKVYFDSEFEEAEQLPRKFTVNFKEVKDSSRSKVKVSVNGIQSGDLIDDNSYINDFYRFHDIFHYAFAAILGWSPCTRSMMKRKRKSDPLIDHNEDGARATITEEAISLILFNEAKKHNFFINQSQISDLILDQIKELTSNFEVSVRTKKDWQTAILKGYALFLSLIENNGGKIHFNMEANLAIYES